LVKVGQLLIERACLRYLLPQMIISAITLAAKHVSQIELT
jgi:hypothetical protein